MSNKVQFTNHLRQDLGVKSEAFNSNNAWGFGGAYGDRFTIKRGDDFELVVKVAVACYRHLPCHNFITVTLNGRRLFDQGQSSKAFAKAQALVAELLAA